MNKIFKMTKVQLEAAFGLSSMLYDIKQNKKNLRKPLLTLVLILLVAPAYALLFMLVKIMYESFGALGTPESVLAIGVVATAGITFVFGLMYTFGALFSSKDLDMLLAMPVKPEHIVASKLLYCIIIEYLFAIPVMFPFVFFYASMFSSGVLFILYALVMTLFMPMIPIALTAVLEMLLIRLFGMRVSAEKVQTVFMFVGLAFGLGVSFLSQSAGRYNGTELADMLADKAAMFSQISAGYFPSKFFASALSQSAGLSGFLYFLAFIAVSAAIFALALVIADKFYIGAVTSGNLTQAAKVTKGSFSGSDTTAMKPQSKAIAIFKYDMRIMLRTGIFMFNTIFIIPMLPIIFAVSMMMQGEGMTQALRAVVGSVGDISGVFYLMIILFMCGITATTSTTFSREGRGFWIQQVIPVSPKDQLLGRCLASVLINAALFVFCVVPVAIIVKWSVVYSAALIITGTILTLIPSLMGAIIDIIRPKLDWDDPAKAVKQNLNSMINFFITIIVAGLFAALSFVLYSAALSTAVIMAALIVITLAVSFLLTRIFYKQAQKHISFK